MDVTVVDGVHLGGHCFLVARGHVFYGKDETFRGWMEVVRGTQ
jgi:hypothetical protein